MIAESTEMHTAIYQALCACLGLAPSSEEAAGLIMEAYTEPENAPQPTRTRDVIYYSLLRDDPGNDGYQVSVDHSSGSANISASQSTSISSFLAYQLVIVCYGPHAESNAHQIRSFLYLDGNGFPRAILRKAGIYPIPYPGQPMILHEPEGSLWRKRADLMISLRVCDTVLYSKQRGTITSPPAVIMWNRGAFRSIQRSIGLHPPLAAASKRPAPPSDSYF